MPNSIPARQNESEKRRYLAAAGAAYDAVAKWTLGKWGLLWLTALLSTLMWWLPALRPYSALVGIAGGFLMLFVFEHVARKQQELGAKFQEVFDTELFDLQWNGVKVGDRPSIERVLEFSREFDRRYSPECERAKTLTDWYPPEIEPLPLGAARLVCQRASSVWDSDLRWSYGLFWLIAIVLVSLVGLLCAVVLSVTVGTALAFAAAWSPLGLAVIGVIKKSWESAAQSSHVLRSLDAAWEGVLNGANPTGMPETRQIQDGLYEVRKNPTRVPSWFYLKGRAAREQQMRQAALEMVQQAHRKSG